MVLEISDVKTLLENDFPGSIVVLQHNDGSKITGSVFWEGFRDVEVKFRNMSVRKTIAKLGLKGQEVGFITPIVGKAKV